MTRFFSKAVLIGMLSFFGSSFGSSLCASAPRPMNHPFVFMPLPNDYTIPYSDTRQLNDELYSYVAKSISDDSESHCECWRRGPRGKTGHQGHQGLPGPGTSIDGSLTVSINEFPFPSGDFTFNLILITPDGREVGTPVFSSTNLPVGPVLLTLPSPLYTGVYLLAAEIVSVNTPGSLQILGTTSNTADTNIYAIQSGISAISALIGRRAVIAAFAVP